MPTQVKIDRTTYTLEKLENGNIRVTHEGTQLHPMQGPGTDGIHSFEVHPCQARWYAYWNDLLPPAEGRRSGPGRDGEIPWWSSRGWKRSKERD